MNKPDALAQIEAEINNLISSPLYTYRNDNGYLPVPGEGNPEAKLLFIGEAPGKLEAETGRPFVGRAGKDLDALLETNGLERKEVFITNIVKDRPPGNRAPTKAEITLYAPFLIRQVEIIQPKIIATLGRFSMEFMLAHFDLPEKHEKIGALHGQPLSTLTSFGNVILFPLYHPAAIFYNRKLEPALAADFTKLVSLL
ncbi:MAG: uracil-DNA glycosylase [Anaerolineaceae bacterium]|nr:uracil-DNA glycosylase [Anaerolineaceae bacterium]